MLKIILYTGLLGMGIIYGLSSPLIALVFNIEAYLINPPKIVPEAPTLRYQFYAAIVLLIAVVSSGQKPLARVASEGRIITCLWLYSIWTVVTSVWAPNSPLAWESSIDFAKTTLVASVMLYAIRSERDLRIVYLACMIGVFHAAIMHTIGVDQGWVSKRWGEEFGVLPDGQATVMCIFLPSFVLMGIFGKNKWEKLLGWGGMPFVLNSITETYQRAYFVALAAEGLLLLLFLPKRIALRLVPIMGAGFLLFMFVLTPQNYWDWMSTISSPTDESSANSRILLYQASLDMLNENPLGVGYANYAEKSQDYVPKKLLDSDGKRSAHSSFTTVACEVGYPGFIPWCLAFGMTLWLLRKVRKKADTKNLRPNEIYSMALEIGLYGWLAGGLFHSDHEADPAYWIAAITVAIVRLNHWEPRVPQYATGHPYYLPPHPQQLLNPHAPPQYPAYQPPPHNGS